MLHTLSPVSRFVVIAGFAVSLHFSSGTSRAQVAAPIQDAATVAAAAADDAAFRAQVQPLLAQYCQRCHHADNMKSGVRVDQLTGALEDRQLHLLENILEQLTSDSMPPADEPQPTAEQRATLTDWIQRTLTAARTRQRDKHGSVRRLTVAQYRNTLRDLLQLDEDLTEILPPDGVSKDGFTNQDKTLLLSPLQLESYFDIAEKALDRCIVDERSKPVIQNFRMDLGASIHPQPSPEALILGANSHLLNNGDFVVTELTPAKPFDYQPFFMRTSYEFIEGYAGNDTVRGWRKFAGLQHAVFACMRGTPGYPKGEAYQVIKDGLLLRPAIPSAEIFGRSDTYGPMANFKISLRELPSHGNFRITVRAARYRDALLLDAGAPVQQAPDSVTLSISEPAAASDATVVIPTDGVYQVDVYRAPGAAPDRLALELDGRQFVGQLLESQPAPAATNSETSVTETASAFLLVRLPAASLKLTARCGDLGRLRRIVLTRLPDGSEPAMRFTAFEQRGNSLGIHLGLRRDCGSTLTRVGEPQAVTSGELREFVFEGAINDFPSPDVERDNVNYLAGMREIGVRSEYTDGRDMPRLLIRSVEFEGPYHASWPPAAHRNIFIDSPHKTDVAAYARDVVRSFASRAFRRPVTTAEQSRILAVWEDTLAETGDFQRSIKDALLVVLTSPQFLFLIESSQGPEAEELDSYELASKLSYFLWNTAPDQRLRELAEQNRLRESLDAEIERLVCDPRFGQFSQEFASQWLSLDKFDVVAVDTERFPKLTRDAKTELRKEPIRFVQYLIQNNLPLRQLVQSDFVVANEVVASYYGLGDRIESGFRFVPIRHESPHLGGLLSQASILAGLSDGREPNPVKRGAWLARKIIAEPPDDPPPNVPQLERGDGSQLTLREKLERHRSQEGCAKCHSGIDPWGLPMERYDAGGLFRQDVAADTRSTLPDGTEIADLNELKAYLADDKLDQVAFSFLKHAACYAVGRSLTYNELVFLRQEGVKFRAQDYRLLDLVRFIVKSELFLQK